MKNYKKYIFDLDNTLLIPDWSMEDEYFKKVIPLDIQDKFFKLKSSIIEEYEINNNKYDYTLLSNYFKKYDLDISEDILRGWALYIGSSVKDIIPVGIIELLEYLKENNKELVVLTSWFSDTQIPRLKNNKLYDYFDNIVTGEVALKPSIEAFNLAIGDTKKELCLMIGDTPRTDIEGAINAGIDYYLIDNNHTIKNLLDDIKKND